MYKNDIPICEKPVHMKSRYAEQEHTHHGSPYLIIKNNKIVINEHFKKDGIPLETILEKVILDAGK